MMKDKERSSNKLSVEVDNERGKKKDNRPAGCIDSNPAGRVYLSTCFRIYLLLRIAKQARSNVLRNLIAQLRIFFKNTGDVS